MSVKFEFAIERRVRARGAILAVAKVAVHTNRRRFLRGEIQAIAIDQAVGIGFVAAKPDRDAGRWAAMMTS